MKTPATPIKLTTAPKRARRLSENLLEITGMPLERSSVETTLYTPHMVQRTSLHVAHAQTMVRVDRFLGHADPDADFFTATFEDADGHSTVLFFSPSHAALLREALDRVLPS